jgi:hypothetical protein
MEMALEESLLSLQTGKKAQTGPDDAEEVRVRVRVRNMVGTMLGLELGLMIGYC